MKRFATLVYSLLALSCIPASAQLGIYGKFDLDHHTDNNANKSVMLYGGGVGLYYNFLHAGPLTVGGDLRGDLTHGSNYAYRSLLFGLPVGFRVPIIRIKPFVQPVAGVGGTKATGQLAYGLTSNYSNHLTYGFIGGIDDTILPHIDWRVIEVGYTREKNGTEPDPNILISTGLALRF